VNIGAEERACALYPQFKPCDYDAYRDNGVIPSRFIL